ncbi:cytochrome P450 [Enhygromyxa salina]|uniref:Cytochrome P450 n=1 Tax=Enhygromyxa salina TaxID=215803 RepID=A0A0C2D812_9BACT|nr:cytochrome P450 [Enhygromyxa salina]KIG17740.1 cytochrome P450 [Enhygromyxa salina]
MNGFSERSLPTPPGKMGLPVVGETLEFLRSPGAFVDARRAKYGPVFFSRILGKPTVYLSGAEANHWVYAGEDKYLKNEWSPAIRELLGDDCLALISGDEHRGRRKLLAPHFRRVGMDASVPSILSVARKHLRRWDTDARLGPMAMVPRIRALAFEIAATYLVGEVGDLGVPLGEFSGDFKAFTAGMFTALAVELPGTKFARAMDARRRMATILDDLVMRRDAGSRRGADVLSTLLEVRDEAGEMLPRDTIVDELQLFLFAGHDTTVTAMSNVIYHLAMHPQVALKARAEQDQLQAGSFTLESVRGMPYLSAVIKESMRMIPPIGAAFRVMTREGEFGGFRIPAGWRIAVCPRLVHSDPQYYPAPERFDPERWLVPAERPPFAYIPFGGGPRMCIGQHFAELEMHIVLAMILREFTWTLGPDQDLSFTEIPTPLPRGGLVLDLRRC